MKAQKPQVVLHPLHGPGLGPLLEQDPSISVVRPADDDAVAAQLLAGADVLVTYRWDDRFMTRDLRWVQAISSGTEQFPLEIFRDQGVILSNAGDTHAPTVALHAISLLLALVRQIGRSVHASSSRLWQPSPGTEVAGRTLGILGLGAIGEETAKLGQALGMHVIGTKRHPAGYRGTAEEVYGPDGTAAVCDRADGIVIALPATEATRGIVGEAELEALGDGWLVNVGRGSVVDESALVSALVDGGLRGAGLDVTETEPLPVDSPLWGLENVVITPHIGAASDAVAPRLAALFRDNLAAFSGSREWRSRVV